LLRPRTLFLLGGKYDGLALAALRRLPPPLKIEAQSELRLGQCLLLVCVAFAYDNRHENVDKVK
jgi:hypothetical protein